MDGTSAGPLEAWWVHLTQKTVQFSLFHLASRKSTPALISRFPAFLRLNHDQEPAKERKLPKVAMLLDLTDGEWL